MATTPNMNLNLPVVGPLGTEGPDWANLLNSAMELIDLHDHSTGKGVKITPAGINVNSDLPFNSFAATELYKTQFESQNSALSGASHANSLNVANGNLYYTNAAGNTVQITSGDSLALTSLGTIGGDYSTSDADLSYFTLGTIFSFKQDATKTADIGCGSIFVYENVAASNYVKLKIPSLLASSYDITFPTGLPSSVSEVLRISPAGVLSSSLLQSSDFDTNVVGNSALRQSAGLSVIGRSANSTGNVADITGASGVLGVNGTSLSFSTVPANQVITASILDAAVTRAKMSTDANRGLSKAFINLNGVAANGTYSRTGTTVTVTLTSHGMTTGMYALLDFTSGTATDGYYQVTVTDANTFTVTDAASGSTSGNVTRSLWVREQYNIASVSKPATGTFEITFSTAFSTAHYIVSITTNGNAGGVQAGGVITAATSTSEPTTKTTTALRINTGATAGGSNVDLNNIHVTCLGV